uniref:Testis cDNA clone: QtsA-11792, similar to human chromosome 6 open reading frame 163 (C6orf163) n=1 Tax=Macaca fascicularis TaxID=9541 RepID=Q4R8Q8_MACFA|nr:unnamed protein product [Macaca fascicularis]
MHPQPHLTEFLLTEVNIFIQGSSQYRLGCQSDQTLGKRICGPKEHLCLRVTRYGEVPHSSGCFRTCVHHPAFLC